METLLLIPNPPQSVQTVINVVLLVIGLAVIAYAMMHAYKIEQEKKKNGEL